MQAHEHKGFSRLVVDLDSKTVSGAVASERGELDTLVTTWGFVGYPLIDLRDTPAANTRFRSQRVQRPSLAIPLPR